MLLIGGDGLIEEAKPSDGGGCRIIANGGGRKAGGGINCNVVSCSLLVSSKNMIS